MARNNNRGGGNRSNSNRSTSGARNNNPSGRNQYSSDWGVMEMARERPIAAAAVAAGAAAAGLFLWTKRAQISDQLSSLSDQVGEWTQNMGSSDGNAFGSFDDTAGLTTSGSGTNGGSSSGRGRTKSTPTAQQ